MKILLTFLISCLFSGLYAQERGEVVYERILAFGEASKSTFHLYFDAKRAAFVEQNPPAAGERVQKLGTEEALEFNVRVGADLPYAVFVDFSEGVLYSRTSGAGNKTILVEEKVPPIPWEIDQETKTVGNFTCRKARGAFRGRTYTAWFTADIPARSGPWKFSGLPGLILEIYDDTGEVYFGARSVKVPVQFGEELLTLQKAGYKRITLQQYVAERDAQVNEVLAAIQSKLPRGSSVDYSQQSVSAIETEFEFD